jgi:LTXXQ motif family protein
MPAAGLRPLSLLAAVVVVLSLASAAQARHGSHQHHPWQDYYSGGRDFRAAAHGAPTQPEANGFAVPTEQTIRACDEQATELKKMPIGTVLQTVQPSDTQRAALEQIQVTAADTANKLTASCPKDVPAKLTDRLDTMRASLDTIKAALLALRPAFVAAYAALDDEQKARLVALSISKPSSQPQSAATATSAGADDQAQPVALDCGQWPAMLKSWPLNRIEAELSLSDEQHAALYTLMAAVYHGAASLAASCHDDNPLTPVRRLDGELGRVDAVHKSVDTIAPALAGFVNALNDEQNAQLNTLLGVAPQPATTAR